MKYGNRSLWKRLFYSPIGILVAFVVLVLLIRGGLSIHQKAIIAQIRLNQTQTELENLQQQQLSLTNSISQLSTPEGIEAALREKYHAVKQGESVAVIVDSQNISNNQSSSSQDVMATPSRSWFGNILNIIGF